VHALKPLILLAILAAMWWFPPPSGLPREGWHLLGVFVAVIAGFLLQAYPMAPMVLFGLLACVLTDLLSMERALAGYGDETVWLVVGAFLLAGAVQGTGLGRRIVLTLVVRLGRSTVGLGYAQAAAELLLGPLVPSNTARGGGILAPICGSLAMALDAESPKRAGAYLSLVGAHANIVTAAMFLTGMAANPIFARAAQDVYGVRFDWTMWALGAIAPGLLTLALLPWVLSKLAPPELRDGRPAQERAHEALAAMGPWLRGERVMAAVFFAMLGLWVTQRWHGLGTALVAWLGLAVLLLTGTRLWKEMAADERTWDALIWLGGLLTLATALKDHGVIAWFAGTMAQRVEGLGTLSTLLVLALVYFYSMYGFSMLTAHLTAMAAAFLGVCHVAGVPSMLAVPLLAYFSNLCACTTNYSTGPVIIYFGLGYVPAATWFRVGFFVSLLHLIVWIGGGLAWWKLLGWW
jgi:anion transporter